MTEQEWLACENAATMAHFINCRLGTNRHKPGQRRLRLFGCACCRLLWEQMTDPRSRIAVEVAERIADEKASAQEAKGAVGPAQAAINAIRKKARQGVSAAAPGWLPGDEERAAEAARIMLLKTGNETWLALSDSYELNTPEYPIYAERSRKMATALRCIFGNPFRPATLDSAWLNSTVTALAKTIYSDRAFDRLPLLADALEDAGCTDAAILEHCRGPGPHVRGCWVVDLLLGKE